ncbi:MAG: alpha/beta hydrolase [Longimicrobiaceae bacterium]
MQRVILLPGMDGTGALFRRFLTASPPQYAPEVVSLPPELRTRAEVAEQIGAGLQLGPDCVMVAESYSGAVAARLAAKYEVAALILCNSFVAPPRHRALRALALPLLFRLPPSPAIIRYFFVGPTASDDLVEEVRNAIARVPARVLAARLAEVLTEDVGDWLARCSARVLYLRGTRDRLVPEASVQRIAALTSAEVVRIAGPHLLLQTAPAEAWAAISEFTARCGAAERQDEADSRPVA